MTDFVLVHGSGQNATGWKRLARQLTAHGHTVAAPELPKQAPDWTLEDHAALIGRAIPRRGSVIVAHSFSGVFLPLLPRVEQCRLLVFLAAIVPEPGLSVREQFTSDPEMFSQHWIAAGPRWFDASEAQQLAREFLFHDCDAATLGWALSSVDTYDTRALVTQPCPLSSWPAVRSAAVVAARDRTLAPAWCRRASQRILAVEPVDIDSGHCPHVSRPAELADLLEQLARSAGR